MPRGNRQSTNFNVGGVRTGFNPNTIIPWNTIRMGSEEFACIKWLGSEVDNDELTDISSYHAWNGMVNGKQQFRYVYCKTNNTYVDENGKTRQVLSGDCDLCKSADQNANRLSSRHSIWVFCFAVYHTGQNPRLNRYDDADHWEHRKVGSRHYYQEKIMKPQILQMSSRMREAFQAYYDRDNDAFQGTVFDLQKRGNAPNITYHVSPTQIPIPSDFDKDIAAIVTELPDVEKVATGELITEWEFPQLATGGESIVEDEEPFDDVDAFEAAGGNF